MKNALTFTLFLWSLCARAQPVVWDGTARSLTFSRGVEVFEDKEKKLSVEQVAAPDFAPNFFRNDKNVLDFKFTDAVFWVKFSVENKTKEPLVLEVAQALLPTVDLYYRDSTGHWQVLRSGYQVNLYDKPIAHSLHVFPLPYHSETLFFCYQSTEQPVPLKLWTKAAYENKRANQVITYGVYMGIMLFVIVLNLFLLVLMRRFTYLHYSVLVFMYTFFSAIFDGYLSYLFPEADLMRWFILNPIVNQFIGVSFCLLFLEVKRYSPGYYSWGLGLLGYTFIYIFAHSLLPLQIVIPLNQFNALLVMIFEVACGFVTGRRGNRIGYMFAAGYLVFFILCAVEVVYLQTGSPGYLFEMTHVSIGIFFEALFLAFLLVQRFQWERADILAANEQAQRQLLDKTLENERIVREQNLVLEETVARRTAQIEEQKAALEKSLAELKLAQSKLVESEKMASLGQLTAGVAHEINNPINFVSVGVRNLIRNFEEAKDLFQSYLNPDTSAEEASRQLADKKRREQVFELFDEAETLFKSIQNGVDRTTSIVRSLRNFSRLDEGEFKPVDLHEGLDSTLEILQSQIRKKAELVKKYGQLPSVKCAAGKINQVFLNIINNALQAMDKPGVLTLETRYLKEKNEVAVIISDTGKGMTEEVKRRLFEPFFTTKPVGEGTGLGLSISYGIIEEHKGRIEVESTEGKGTKFVIYLPVRPLEQGS